MSAGVNVNLEKRIDRPFCECGECDSTGRKGGPEVRLPLAAWAVAGHGDLYRLAVAPAHGKALLEKSPGVYAAEKHRGWWAIMEAP